MFDLQLRLWISSLRLSCKTVVTYVNCAIAELSLKVLILDTCHSGAAAVRDSAYVGYRTIGDPACIEKLPKSVLTKEFPFNIANYLEDSCNLPWFAEGDMLCEAVVLTACSSAELATETEVQGRYFGLFSYHLMEEMRTLIKEKKRITYEDLVKRTKLKVL